MKRIPSLTVAATSFRGPRSAYSAFAELQFEPLSAAELESREI